MSLPKPSLERTWNERHALHRATERLSSCVSQLEKAASSLDGRFVEAATLLAECEGRVVVSGVGKSGIAARKVAATLACTGCPSFFVHPSDAAHGDLGALTGQDVVVLISFSGATRELLWLLPRFEDLGVPVVAITGDGTSPLARAADVALVLDVDDDGPVPVASTLVTQALGDVLALAVMDARRLSAADVEHLHPGSPASERSSPASERSGSDHRALGAVPAEAVPAE